MEVLLAVSLLVLLASVVVLNLPVWSQTQLLAEGAQRFETLIYMAKADAANLGRKLRLGFQPDQQGALQVVLTWEPDPLAAPGQFVPYSACTWLHHIPIGLVAVSSCRLTGVDEYVTDFAASSTAEGTSATRLDPITFYPDGRCDSATIDLVSLSGDDQRVAVIDIDGFAGSVTRRILTSSELAELEQ